MAEVFNSHIVEAKGGVKRWEDYDTVVCPDGSVVDMKALIKENRSVYAACRKLCPVFGGLINQLKIKYTFQVATQATDGFCIYVNPQFTAQTLNTPTKKFAVFMHELMHCILQHMRRGKDDDPRKSNIAADYEVNCTLSMLEVSKNVSIVSPSTWKEIDALYDPKYNKLGYETIYGMNPTGPKNEMDNPQGASDAASNSPGDQDKSGKSGGSKGQSTQGNKGASDGQGSGDDDKDSGQGQGGTGSGGTKSGKQGQKQGGGFGSGFRKDQNGRDDPEAKPGQNQGRVRPEDCMGQASQELKDVPGNAGGMIKKDAGDQISISEGYEKEDESEKSNEKKWKDLGDQVAREASKMQGTGEGWGLFASKINNLNKITVDWKRKFRLIIGSCINPAEKRRAYANKNQLVLGNIKRTDKDEYNALYDIISFIDTSGSMSDKYLAECLKQTYQVANQKKAMRIIIVPFDDGPRDVIIYDKEKKLYNDLLQGKVKLKGRGGTDVRPCFEMLKTDPKFRGKQFELVMVFTDGYLDQVSRKAYMKNCRNLVWIISNNTSFNLEYPDPNTKVIYLDVSTVDEE